MARDFFVTSRGQEYPVDLETDLNGEDVPVTDVKTSAPCPKCTETPTEWKYVMEFGDFVDRKPGQIECQNCDAVLKLEDA